MAACVAQSHRLRTHLSWSSRLASPVSLASLVSSTPGLLIPYGGSAVKSGRADLAIGEKKTCECSRTSRPSLDGHRVPALVGVNVVHARCAARAPRWHLQRARHGQPGSRKRPSAPLRSPASGLWSCLPTGVSWVLDLFRGRVGRSSGGGGRLGYGRLFGLAGPAWTC